MMTCGECGNVTAPGAGFPNHVYCKRFLLHMEKRENASRCRDFILKSQTNGDKMRAMSDEELATLLTDVAKKSAEKLCESLKIVDVDINNCNFDILYKVHLDWLKKEVEE